MLLFDDKASVVFVFEKVISTYGEDVLAKDYEAETLLTIMSPLNVEKFFAFILVANHNQFWDDVEVFARIVPCFNNRPANFSHLELPTVGELCWCLLQVSAIDPVGLFSNSVMHFIAGILVEEGWIEPPSQLSQLKSIEGVPLQFFIDTQISNKSHTTDSAAVQKVRQELIDLYVATCQADLVHQQELKQELV